MTREWLRRPEELDLRTLAHQGPVHFVGISGAGMASLAELVLRAGGRVSGCDVHPGETGDALRDMGATVVEGHDPAHVEDAVAVVTTAAVPQDHPELSAARRRGVPVLKRAAALGALVNRGKVVAIAGTHGKTTTTAMATAVLVEAGLDPTAFVGGRVPAWGSGLRAGSDTLFVVEADEYDRSFLTLRPNIAVVTTVEADHLDIFGTLEAVEEAFLTFLSPLPEDGVLVACHDDDGARRVMHAIDRRTLGYGLERGATLRAFDVEMRGRGSRSVVRLGRDELGQLILHVPGAHNLRNALAAVAVALEMDVDFETAARALADFGGVARRFQQLSDAHGIAVVDDYAHHPSELRATLSAARGIFPGRRLVALYQPHLYTRTRDFATDFGDALAAADVAWVTDVYPAREAPIPGVTGELVVDAARHAGAREVHYHAAVETLAERVRPTLHAGDACVFLGAGSITEAAHALARQLRDGEART